MAKKPTYEQLAQRIRELEKESAKRKQAEEKLHPMITIKTNLGSDLFNVNGSPVHIRKAVMNLVSNASEAIEGSGNVTISTMNRYIDRPLRGYDYESRDKWQRDLRADNKD